MSGKHFHSSKKNEGETAKITDLTISEGEPTARADIGLDFAKIELTVRSIDQARIRVKTRSSSNLRVAWGATSLTVAGGITVGLLVAFLGDYAHKQVFIYIVTTILVGVFGAALGLFLSARSDSHEEAALSGLADAVRKLPSDPVSVSEVPAEGEAAGDPNE
jgi:hypothetical protein